MSPILDLQRRLREAGRLRIGEKVPTNNGRSRPSKLEVFRLTSSDERSIRSAAAIYGGDVAEWKDAPVGEQWELKTETKTLDVIVPPVDLAFSQWMEAWSGGGCTRRCDGQTNVVNNSPCACDPDAPDCKPTTRLGVILRDLEGIGLWRLEVHGWNGAQELLGSIEVLRTLQARGQMVPARLLLEQRQSKRDGKTFNFGVPVLDLQLSVAALTAGTTPTQLPSVPVNAPSVPPVPIGTVPGVTPIPAGPAEPTPTIGEQVRAAETPAPRPRRSNSAAALPPTGLAPRTAAVAEAREAASRPSTSAERIVAGASTPVSAPDQALPGVEPVGDALTTAQEPTTSDAKPVRDPDKVQRTTGGASQPSMRRLFALLGGKGIRSDDERHAWASTVLQRDVASYSDLSQAEVTKLNDAIGSAPARSEPEYGPGTEPF